jgi:hypothetical protein
MPGHPHWGRGRDEVVDLIDSSDACYGGLSDPGTIDDHHGATLWLDHPGLDLCFLQVDVRHSVRFPDPVASNEDEICVDLVVDRPCHRIDQECWSGRTVPPVRMTVNCGIALSRVIAVAIAPVNTTTLPRLLRSVRAWATAVVVVTTSMVIESPVDTRYAV